MLVDILGRKQRYTSLGNGDNLIIGENERVEVVIKKPTMDLAMSWDWCQKETFRYEKVDSYRFDQKEPADATHPPASSHLHFPFR